MLGYFKPFCQSLFVSLVYMYPGLKESKILVDMSPVQSFSHIKDLAPAYPSRVLVFKSPAKGITKLLQLRPTRQHLRDLVSTYPTAATGLGFKRAFLSGLVFLLTSKRGEFVPFLLSNRPRTNQKVRIASIHY